MPKKLWRSVRWFRHRKDGVPKKFGGSVRCFRHRKHVVARKLVVS